MTTLSQPLKVATALERRQRQGNVTNVMKVREVKPAKKKDLSELLGCCGNKMNSRQGSIHSNFIEIIDCGDGWSRTQSITSCFKFFDKKVEKNSK